jgi:hypothetical protein
VTTATALLVEGAFLLVDDALTQSRRDVVVDSVLLAWHIARSADHSGGHAGALTEVLANIGWTATSASRSETELEGSLIRGPVPLAIIAQELDGLLPTRLTGELVAGVDALEKAGPDTLRAWDTKADDPDAQAALLMVATLDGDQPMLAYDYAVLSPAKPSKGYPWTRLKGPGTLTQQYGALVLNASVLGSDLGAQLAARVAPLLPTAVIQL